MHFFAKLVCVEMRGDERARISIPGERKGDGDAALRHAIANLAHESRTKATEIHAHDKSLPSLKVTTMYFVLLLTLWGLQSSVAFEAFGITIPVSFFNDDYISKQVFMGNITVCACPSVSHLCSEGSFLM